MIGLFVIDRSNKFCLLDLFIQAARLRVRRATEAAASRQRVTFQADPSSAVSTTKTKGKKVHRRVSLGVAVNAETGEILDFESKRKSRRQSTMLNSQDLHSRLLVAEKRRVIIYYHVCSLQLLIRQIVGISTEENEGSCPAIDSG